MATHIRQRTMESMVTGRYVVVSEKFAYGSKGELVELTMPQGALAALVQGGFIVPVTPKADQESDGEVDPAESDVDRSDEEEN